MWQDAAILQPCWESPTLHSMHRRFLAECTYPCYVTVASLPGPTSPAKEANTAAGKSIGSVGTKLSRKAQQPDPVTVDVAVLAA